MEESCTLVTFMLIVNFLQTSKNTRSCGVSKIFRQNLYGNPHNFSIITEVCQAIFLTKSTRL
jgi:hypothetical protein